MNRRSLVPLALLGCCIAQTAGAAGPADEDVARRRAEAGSLAGRAEAIVPLLGLLEDWESVDDRGSIDALLDGVRNDPKQRADVRARAAWLRAITLEREGKPVDARALRMSLGLVVDWRVIGPFDNDGRGAFAEVLPPEADLAKAIDETHEYAGRGRAVKWRALPESLLVQGMLPIDAALRPADNSAAMLTTFVNSSRAQDVALHLGSTGAIKVWVNGQVVFARDVYRTVRFDQDVAGAHLVAGWNRVTIKLCAAESGSGLFFRVTAPDGKPVKLSVDGAHATAVAIAAPAVKGSAPRVQDLGADLRRSSDQRALGLWLHFVTPDDPEEKSAVKVLDKNAEAHPSTESYRLAALAAMDANDRRKRLELALAPALVARATPTEHARALLGLGQAYAHSKRERRAEELYREALALAPGLTEASIAIAELASDRGVPAEGEKVLETAGAHPSLAVIRARARLAERRGLRTRQLALYGELLTGYRGDLEALRALFTDARARGDIKEALALLDEMAAARPELSSMTTDRVALLDGNGRTKEAEAVAARALGMSPDDPALLESDARLLHRLGDEEGALARMRRALELRPQNPELRAYEREIASHRKSTGPASDAAGDLARAWQVPMAGLLSLAKQQKPVASDGDAARVLLDLKATRVHSNGLSETFNQRVVEILDARGAREQGEVDIRYTPDTQSVEVKVARVHKRNGEIEEAVSEADRDLSEPGYGLYYDVHAQAIQLPHLEPGDVVDVEYVVSDVGRRNLLSDYFGDVHYFQEEIPRVESRYVLITPKSRSFYFNEPRLASITREVADKGEERIYTWRATSVPKIAAEPGMPGFSDVSAYLHVSTYKTWNEVATWYRGLVAEQLIPDDVIRQAAQTAIQGVAPTDEKEKIRRIYDWVIQKTRYVGLEFGIHGYKPYKVSQIYARKFGDCKDKASLLVVMLKEIGVEATMVLARTRHGGDLDPYPASLAPFDHAIAYLPKYDLYLDGTAEFSGSAELPAQDQDIPVLRVNQGQLVRTPVLSADHNRVVREVDVTLSASGGAHATIHSTVSGEVAHDWRSHYQSAGEQRERFEKAENAAHPGAHIEKIEFSSLALESPVDVRAGMDVPQWARSRGADLEMPALGHEGELARSYARLSERRYDLVLGFPWEQEERVRYALPPGYAPRQMPEAATIDAPFGRFALTATREGADVVVHTSLNINRHRIARADYAAFRKFCTDVDRAVGQSLVITHEGGQ